MLGRSRPPLSAYPAERIALLKPSALGDIIHSLPVLTALRQRYRHAHITWVVNRVYEPLLRGHRDLDDILAFDRRASRCGWLAAARSWLRFLGELRRRRFDLVLDLQGLSRTALMVLATGAKRRVGLSTAREGATWTYTDVIPVGDFNALHAVDRYWLAAEALGAGGVPRQFHVPIFEGARHWAEEMMRGCPRPWLMVGPGSRWPTKRWPPEHFAALVRRAQREFGGTIFFVGGGDETPLAAAVRAYLAGPAHDLTGRTTLPQLAALLERADVMLANDTGPLHLAAALGRPVVAPYTCTKVRLNGPYGAEHGAVESAVPCQGSYVKRCPRMACMTELTPDRLWPLLCEVLRLWQSRSRSA
ncbi:MAG TPA: glycosyltransferase family 9 protein [Gemmataceae bacterium]|jgi:lipopolysaccharide heptosyltransferase I